MTRVLLVDDHPLFRRGLRLLLGTVDGFEVVGEAATGEDAVTLAAELAPDLVVMDLHLPGISGMEATRRVTAREPRPHVLVLTLSDDDQTVFAALRAGALGYVLKDADETTMLRALAATADGEALFSPTIARRVLAYFSGLGTGPPQHAFPTLTDREDEILRLVARGLGNSSIAAELSLSVKTVANYTSTVFTKLQVASRAEAIVRARDRGYGS